VIDLHAHVLAGVDDGPATLDDALDVLRAMAADGVTAVAATPHVRDDFPTTPERMRAALAEVREAVAAAEIPVEVLPGGEVSVDRARAWMRGGGLEAFGLGGNPHYLLVEFPYHGWPLDLKDVLSGLAVTGMRPVLAHPERNPQVQARPQALASLVQAGALVQVTASSVTGAGGERARRTAAWLVEQGLVHLVASDAHELSLGRASLSSARASLGPELAGWLTHDLPAAIVDDAPLPPRPAGGLPRLRRRLALRRR
jgi:protein-tyrosine phosphatase